MILHLVQVNVTILFTLLNKYILKDLLFLKAKMNIFAVVLATIASASPASGYGNGAPVNACANMIPGHGVVPQVSGSPYTLALSSAKYGCGVNNVSGELSIAFL